MASHFIAGASIVAKAMADQPTLKELWPAGKSDDKSAGLRSDAQKFDT